MRKLNGIFDNGILLGIVIIVLTVALVLGIAFGVACLEGWVVMLLWNAVVPLIWANAPTLTFWAAMGLTLLCNILFGSVVRVSSGKK